MAEHSLNIFLGQFDPKTIDALLKFSAVNQEISIKVKEHEGLPQSLASLVDLDGYQSHNLADVHPVILFLQVLEDHLSVVERTTLVGVHDVVDFLALVFVTLYLHRQELVNVNQLSQLVLHNVFVFVALDVTDYFLLDFRCDSLHVLVAFLPPILNGNLGYIWMIVEEVML